MEKVGKGWTIFSHFQTKDNQLRNWLEFLNWTYAWYIVCLDPYLEAVFKREQTKATSVQSQLAASEAIYEVHDFFYRLWH